MNRSFLKNIQGIIYYHSLGLHVNKFNLIKYINTYLIDSQWSRYWLIKKQQPVICVMIKVSLCKYLLKDIVTAGIMSKCGFGKTILMVQILEAAYISIYRVGQALIFIYVLCSNLLLHIQIVETFWHFRGVDIRREKNKTTVQHSSRLHSWFRGRS